MPVTGGLREQVADGVGGAQVPMLAHPCLLFPDDLDHVAADEDGVRRRVDLRLLVAEPRDHPALRDGGGVQAGDVGQRLEVHHQHFAGPASGHGLDEPGPHDRGMSEPGQLNLAGLADDGAGLLGRQAEELDVGEHAAEIGVVDVVAFVGLADLALTGPVGGAEHAGMAVGERQPPGIVQGFGGLSAAVGHDPVEQVDRLQVLVDRPRLEAAADLGAARRLALPVVQEGAEVQREDAQASLGVVGQGRVVDSALGHERGEARRVHAVLHHRRPGQLPGFHLQP
ncbi:hypothetical protein [Streptomyces sp. NPDC001530]|uniref:hypothetical protein n=1 Tax=Streptomyces sp. NPDC001530 TaxID=3364582 RepID=UPI0036D03308